MNKRRPYGAADKAMAKGCRVDAWPVKGTNAMRSALHFAGDVRKEAEVRMEPDVREASWRQGTRAAKSCIRALPNAYNRGWQTRSV